jgi:hypothetical protein
MEYQTPAARGVEDWAADWKLNPEKPGLLPKASTREKEGRRRKAARGRQKAEGGGRRVFYFLFVIFHFPFEICHLLFHNAADALYRCPNDK